MAQNHTSSGDNVAGNKTVFNQLSKPVFKIIFILIISLIVISGLFLIFSNNGNTGINGNNNDNNEIIIND